MQFAKANQRGFKHVTDDVAWRRRIKREEYHFSETNKEVDQKTFYRERLENSVRKAKLVTEALKRKAEKSATPQRIP